MTCTLSYNKEMHASMSTGVLYPPTLDALSDLCKPGADVGYSLVPSRKAFEYPIGVAESTSQVTQVKWVMEYIPRTALGRKLVALRKKALVAGLRLFSEEEVLIEMKLRRGELEEHEAEADLH